MRAGLQCNGKGSLVSFIVSLNLHRRHLNESQRALVAAKIANMQQGERTDLSQICETLSQPQAAELLNVSRRAVQQARKVRESGDKKLIAAVQSGEVTVSGAAQHVAAVTRYPDKAKEARP
jgi:DNA-binding transcriptional regulator YiaG